MRLLFKFVLIIPLAIFLVFLTAIIFQSYMSFKFDCTPEIEIPAECVSGSFQITNNSEGYEIKIYQQENTTEYINTLKHERVHLYQFRQQRTFSCNFLFGLGVMHNEFEAYTSEYIPNWLYKIIYP